MANITISLPNDLLKELDAEKGLAPRSAYIADILRRRKQLPRDSRCQKRKSE